MRVKTKEKRQEIVQAAAELFAELGYERTSMSAISERVGGSKATLYGYFQSKDDLLRAVLAADVEKEVEHIMQELPDEENLREALIEMGVSYLSNRLSDLPIANLRTVATQPPESTIGKEFYATVLQPAWELLANHLEALMEDGLLRQGDPWTAAMHWKGLNEGEVFEKRLLGAISGPNPKEIKKQATLAADAFLRIYGTQPEADEQAQESSAKAVNDAPRRAARAGR